MSPGDAVQESSWVVTIRADHRGQIDEVAEELSGAGLRIGQVLRSLGHVTGTASAQDAEGLRGIAGVASVDPDRPVHLAPPEAGVQ